MTLLCTRHRLLLAVFALCVFVPLASAARERLSMDPGWRFAFGHPSDPRKDFNHATGYFSYLAKAGFGDGPAAAGFDDRGWRVLDLPHDWAAEAPFSSDAGYSHGYKAIGRAFPDRSVGWYRKTFPIPASDLGRRISLRFDGVFRDSQVWINGFYLGREPSGYTSFRYDVTDYLNYGGENVVSVRVDATMEEGWFYEGAGIYRHTWLEKTAPLHVAADGTAVTTALDGSAAEITARTTVTNDGTAPASFELTQAIVSADDRTLATTRTAALTLPAGETGEFANVLRVPDAQLWSLETPTLHTLVTTLSRGGVVVDRYETKFGIRTVRFDPNEGFFLNGRRVELKGTNNHQDYAGVGVAVPDALQEVRIARLKAMGSNAWRCAHNPPNPELLDACDRLGLLVIDEHRLMGPSPEQLSQLRHMILRDRNHPSVILWSIGNEEWGIEGNIKGARITASMQAFAQRLDPSRRTTVAISGGWGGTSTVVDVVGYNYIHQSDPDKQHADFPHQPGVGTEETTTQMTRGVYFDDRAHGHIAPLEHGDSGGNCEIGWKYYAARPYLAGLFYWTGFDYRGEPNPVGWPQVASQFGLLDLCGFPKDPFYYLQSWWTDAPVLHIAAHWNWPGREGRSIAVWCYSNADEVELFLNGRSLGRKPMEKNGHLEWAVPYAPGSLVARGFTAGREIATDRVDTAGAPASLQLVAARSALAADGADATVVDVQVLDAQGRFVPVADTPVEFSLLGPGKIIGVGNGDPASHEPDRFVDDVKLVNLHDWREHAGESGRDGAELSPDVDVTGWAPAFREPTAEAPLPSAATMIYRTDLERPLLAPGATMRLFLRNFGAGAAYYLNGRALTPASGGEGAGPAFDLSPELFRAGKNVLAIVAAPPRDRSGREQMRAVAPAVLQIVTPAGAWRRRAFNGLAQVIVQATEQPGEIVLTAKGEMLPACELKLAVRPAHLPPAVVAGSE